MKKMHPKNSTMPVGPVLGPQAKTALRLPIEGQKRRKLLTLIAAYADAGNHEPSLRMLAARLSFIRPELVRGHPRVPYTGLLHLLWRLEAEGWITMTPPHGQSKPVRYTLHLGQNAKRPTAERFEQLYAERSVR